MRKVHLMDKTMDSMTMTVWHSDYQERMDQWQPLQTILHLVDVQVKYSDFERSTVLIHTSRTIITENPIRSTRSAELMAYMHSLSLDKIESLKSNQPGASIDAASIKEILTVKRILDQIERDNSNEIAAIVIGVITKFDINSAIIKTCVHCKRFVQRNREYCDNDTCNLTETNEPRIVDRIYMNVSIADHSGTLNCRMVDENAQNALGYTADELKMQSEEAINATFNRFMLQRFAIKVIVKPKSTKDYFASILAIEHMESDDMATALKL